MGNTRDDGLNVPATPYAYVCMAAGAWPDPYYLVRTRGDPRRVLNSIRSVVRGAAPNRAIYSVETLEDHMRDALERPRLTSRMLTIFAVAALVLAAMGLYSVLTLFVIDDMRSIGVRVALGATRTQIVEYVFADAVRLIAIRAAGGAALVFAAERVLRSLLFEVSPADAYAVGAVVQPPAAVPAFAILAPEIRAATINPVRALRVE